MSYTKHTWQDDEVITAEKLNNMENGIEGAYASANLGYDLIIQCDWFQSSIPSEHFTILKGNILDCEDKVDRGEMITGLAVMPSEWSYIPSGANTNKNMRCLPLSLFESPYTLLRFGAVYKSGSTSVAFITLDITYNPDTGSIESGSYYSKTL